MTTACHPAPIRVAVSDKAFQSNLGGNTSYTRSVYSTLGHLGVSAQLLSPPWPSLKGVPRKIAYTFTESLLWPRSRICDRVDLIHYPTDTGAIVRGRVPIVATVHGVENAPVPGMRRALWKQVWLTRVGRLLSIADAAITVSESSAREIEATFGYPVDRLTVIPHGVDHSRFHPSAESDAAVLEQLQLPERFIFYLGNLDPRKNAHLLAQAIDLPALRELNVPLIVAGGSFLGSEALERSLRNHPGVRHLGQVPDAWVAPLMRAASVYVLPSSHEGFGMPVLEAMACGTPVVVSKRAALPEVAGDAGVMVNDLSADVIAKALHSVLTDGTYAAELRQRGLARASRYTWQASAERHLEVFHSVA